MLELPQRLHFFLLSPSFFLLSLGVLSSSPASYCYSTMKEDHLPALEQALPYLKAQDIVHLSSVSLSIPSKQNQPDEPDLDSFIGL
jgi:hypothetical protein